jgi:hypothetical protein
VDAIREEILELRNAGIGELKDAGMLELGNSGF